MSPLLLAGLCGFLGGILAVFAIFFYLTRTKADAIMISLGPRPRLSKEIEMLNHEWLPHGLYVRFKNCGKNRIESAHFLVRAYKDGKLWAECEPNSYVETMPGAEQEAVLELWSQGSVRFPLDLAGCRIEVKCKYGYVEESLAA